jgi:hypothetical protein
MKYTREVTPWQYVIIQRQAPPYEQCREFGQEIFSKNMQQSMALAIVSSAEMPKLNSKTSNF